MRNFADFFFEDKSFLFRVRDEYERITRENLVKINVIRIRLKVLSHLEFVESL